MIHPGGALNRNGLVRGTTPRWEITLGLLLNSEASKISSWSSHKDFRKADQSMVSLLGHTEGRYE